MQTTSGQEQLKGMKRAIKRQTTGWRFGHSDLMVAKRVKKWFNLLHLFWIIFVQEEREERGEEAW